MMENNTKYICEDDSCPMRYKCKRHLAIPNFDGNDFQIVPKLTPRTDDQECFFSKFIGDCSPEDQRLTDEERLYSSYIRKMQVQCIKNNLDFNVNVDNKIKNILSDFDETINSNIKEETIKRDFIHTVKSLMKKKKNP